MKRPLRIVTLVSIFGLAIALAACSRNPVSSSAQLPARTLPAMSAAGVAAAASASLTGVGETEHAYYDSMLFTINESEMPSQAEQSVLAHNPGFNFIYELDEVQGASLVDVLDAIPTDGMNPLWRQVLITFNPGFTPRQLFSDDQVNAAAAGGEITLDTTNVVFRCAVIGQKPK